MVEDIFGRLTEELKLRGRSPRTVESYQTHVRKFLTEVGKSGDAIEIDDIKKYQLRLIEKGLKPQTVNLRVASVRFLCLEVLKKPWPGNFIARVKNPKRIPEILSQEEMAQLILSGRNLKELTVLMTLYATGLRSGELSQLKTGDIDSGRKVIHVRNGKGGKNRFAQLSPFLLWVLRNYWVNWKSDDRKYFLFPSSTNNQEPVKTSWIATIFRLAKKKAGITKSGGPHLARHCYATHLMESGVSIRIVQLLLGHSQISSTEIYTHLRQDQVAKIPNPLDQIANKIRSAG